MLIDLCALFLLLECWE